VVDCYSVFTTFLLKIFDATLFSTDPEQTMKVTTSLLTERKKIGDLKKEKVK